MDQVVTPENIKEAMALLEIHAADDEREWAAQRIYANMPYNYLAPIWRGDTFPKMVKEYGPVEQAFITNAVPFSEYEEPILDNIDAVLDEGYNFVFCGAQGGGKTYSALNIISEAISWGKSAYYINSQDLYSLYNKTHYSNNLVEPFDLRLWKYISTVDFLCLDEFGKENKTEQFLYFAERVLKDRSNRRMCTIVCTNLDSSEVSKGLASVSDIVRGSFFVYQFARTGDMRAKTRKSFNLKKRG